MQTLVPSVVSCPNVSVPLRGKWGSFIPRLLGFFGTCGHEKV